MALEAGGRRLCARDEGGRVDCWHVGEPNGGESDGDGRSASDGTSSLDTPDFTFRDVAASPVHSCGIRDDGSIVCWGTGTELQKNEGGEDVNQGVTRDGTVQGWTPPESPR